MLWKIFAREESKWKDAEDFARECYQAGVIAVGWSEIGDLNAISARDELHQILTARFGRYARAGHKSISQWTGSLWKFRNDVKPGHYVVCPDGHSRRYYVGVVRSKKVYHDETPLGACEFAHRRRVKWKWILHDKDIKSVWPAGAFGGNQTVSRISWRAADFLRFLKAKHRRVITRTRPPVAPDKEWGREAELRAMKWLREQGYDPTDEADRNYGWDISCGENKFEVKGRKSFQTAIRLTANEWNAAKQLQKKYTLLVFTAANKEALASASPSQHANPANTESWTTRIVREYLLLE